MPGGIPTGIFDAILNGFALACKTTAFGLQANAAGAGKSPVRFYLSFNDRSVCRKKGTAARKVRMSAAAIKYRMPSSPKNRGSRRGNPTPKTISRRVESRVESPALPKACRKMKMPLLTQESVVAQRRIRMLFRAKSI